MKLKDCCLIIAGQSPESKYYNTEGNGLPFFQGKADFGVLYPTIRVYCSKPTKVAEKGDILLSVRAPVGPTNLAPCTVCIGRGLTAIRPSDKLLTRYVLLYFRYFEAQLASKGTGTTFKAITQDVVKNLDIPVPSLDEQARIVARIEEMFSELDAGVETLKKTKAQLAVYRQAVVEDAIKTTKNHGATAKPFGEYVSQYQNGISKRSGEGTSTPVLRLADIDRQRINTGNGLRNIGLTDVERSRFLLNKGDLLIIRVNGSENNVGRSIIVDTGGTYAACDHFIRCTVDSTKLLTEYAQLSLDSFSARKYIKDNMVSSAGQNTVSQTTMNAITVYVPEIPIQKEIMITVNERLSICDSIEQTVDAALKQAEAMRQSILKEAFEGRL